MKIYKIYLLAVSLIFSMSACQDFFIKELDIPRQDLDRQLVVHSFISDLDTSLYFKVARNFDLDQSFEEPESLVPGATIRIFRGSELMYELESQADSNYRMDLSQAFGYSNENFRIEVSHPDFETAIVETSMPPFIMPESIKFTKDGGFANPNSEDRLDRIQITINDPADEENYYEFQIQQVLIDFEEIIFGEDTFRIETRYPENYFTPDANFDQGVSGFLLSDQLFNGQSYTFQVMLDSNLEEGVEIPVDKLRVTWNCVSRDHYEYSKTLLKYQRSSGFGLFSDPVAVYSNVDNGLGIVSLRSSRALEVQEN